MRELLGCKLSCWVLKMMESASSLFFFLEQSESDRDFVFHVLCRTHGFSNWQLQQLTTHQAHSSALLRCLIGWLDIRQTTSAASSSTHCPCWLMAFFRPQKSKSELPPLHASEDDSSSPWYVIDSFDGAHWSPPKTTSEKWHGPFFLTWVEETRQFGCHDRVLSLDTL